VQGWNVAAAIDALTDQPLILPHKFVKAEIKILLVASNKNAVSRMGTGDPFRSHLPGRPFGRSPRFALRPAFAGMTKSRAARFCGNTPLRPGATKCSQGSWIVARTSFSPARHSAYPEKH
jgi:hypothetical protein